ncbi:hypothetical protein Misp06_03547 [Microbulbifer sp. NBRC 101763]|uniref:HAD family hydrolase n=1 Tax=Microbulbifer sp. NBRC 101763 TaxID=1113820 RepID=UPI0030968D0A
MSRQLVVLDLDETLIHSCHEWIGKKPSFSISNAMVHIRPGAERLLAELSEHFVLAVWTASYGLYTQDIVKRLFGGVDNLEFLLTREDCAQITENDGYDALVKDTRKIVELGWSYENFIVIDDKPHLVKSEYNNVIEVKPYYGSTIDEELFTLADQIVSLKGSNLKNAAKI